MCLQGPHFYPLNFRLAISEPRNAAVRRDPNGGTPPQRCIQRMLILLLLALQLAGRSIETGVDGSWDTATSLTLLSPCFCQCFLNRLPGLQYYIPFHASSPRDIFYFYMGDILAHGAKCVGPRRDLGTAVAPWCGLSSLLVERGPMASHAIVQGATRGLLPPLHLVEGVSARGVPAARDAPHQAGEPCPQDQGACPSTSLACPSKPSVVPSVIFCHRLPVASGPLFRS